MGDAAQRAAALAPGAGEAGPGRCAVVGAGVIGMAVAWRLAQAGLHVTVVDPSPGSGASHVAAGMLAPVSEAHWGEEALLRMNLASSLLWPGFASELEGASGRPVHLGTGGTLVVGLDGDDVELVEDLAQLHGEMGLVTERLRSRACREVEPLLAPSVRGGMLVPGDLRVDPREVLSALEVVLDLAGVALVRERASRLLVDGDRAVGVELATGGAVLADAVVLAAGCWSADIPGIPTSARPPVRPVKGQLLVLRSPSPDLLPSRSVRGWVKGSHVYVVPRDDGRVVVGATQEERGFDTTVTAGAVHDLLRDAALLLPALLEHEVVEVLAGLRPGTADNRPLIGPVPGVEGLVLATGHHRNGVLLAPITADSVVGHLAALREGATP